MRKSYSKLSSCRGMHKYIASPNTHVLFNARTLSPAHAISHPQAHSLMHSHTHTHTYHLSRSLLPISSPRAHPRTVNNSSNPRGKCFHSPKTHAAPLVFSSHNPTLCKQNSLLGPVAPAQLCRLIPVFII